MLLEVAASIFCYDIWFYISHRLLHTSYLWPIHKIHHEKREPTYWDTYHGHWFESVFQSIGTFIPYLFLSYGWMDTVITLLFLNIRGMLRHESRLVGWWSEIEHHVEHHRMPKYNFGECWLDIVCGTWYGSEGSWLYGNGYILTMVAGCVLWLGSVW